VNVLTSDAQFLYAGIEGQGVWKRPLSEVALDVADDQGATPQTYSLDQNYPNPFNPSTTIRFALPGPSTVRIVVYSLLGQEVATIVDGDLAAGVHSVLFDGSRLASGVYFYRMQVRPSDSVLGRDSRGGAGGFQGIKSMVLVR
jgi:hypothetical protein